MRKHDVDVRWLNRHKKTIQQTDVQVALEICRKPFTRWCEPIVNVGYSDTPQKNNLLGDAIILPLTIAEIQTWIVGLSKSPQKNKFDRYGVTSLVACIATCREVMQINHEYGFVGNAIEKQSESTWSKWLCTMYGSPALKICGASF